MPQLHLIEGPVGAGKSTYASALANRTGGIPIALDAWFARLFSPDRPSGGSMPWYLERKDRLVDLIWAHSLEVLAANTDVILELGLVQRQPRTAFCLRARDQGFPPALHIVNAPRELRRERVRRRNVEQGPTFSMIVPDPLFDIASDLWEAPDEFECAEFAIEFIHTARTDASSLPVHRVVSAPVPADSRTQLPEA